MVCIKGLNLRLISYYNSKLLYGNYNIIVSITHQAKYSKLDIFFKENNLKPEIRFINNKKFIQEFIESQIHLD